MKKMIASCLFALLAITAFAQSGDKKIFTAADYQQAVKFLGFNTSKLIDRNNVSPNWMDDGKFWYSVNVGAGKEFVLINPADGSRKTAADKKTLLPDAPPDKDANASGRRNFSNDILSPDGKKVVFIRDWNLWIRDIASKKESPLTTDGTKDFGYATDNAGW